MSSGITAYVRWGELENLGEEEYVGFMYGVAVASIMAGRLIGVSFIDVPASQGDLLLHELIELIALYELDWEVGQGQLEPLSHESDPPGSIWITLPKDQWPEQNEKRVKELG